MTYCVIPGCQHPHNPDTNRICQSCGGRLLLRERYRPLKPLGQGGFGRTFLAQDEDIPSRPVCVVKQLCLANPTPQQQQKAIELFHREAQRLDELGSHPQIPDLLAHFEQNHLLYLVQEYIDGPTLEQDLNQRGIFQEAEIRQLLQDVLPVLSFIHDRRVVHRDIKPTNLIRRRQNGQLVLIDFGIAKILSSVTALQTGTIVGSPEYMAPEQNRGKTLPASDLYSLGMVCIGLLTGRSPADLFDPDHDRWNWQAYLPAGQVLSPSLIHILNKLLKNALNQRFQTADQVLQALNDLAPQGPMTPQAGSNPRLTTASLPPPFSTSPPQIQVNTQNLQRLLKAKRWREADAETWHLIRKMIHKTSSPYVLSSELQRLPCEGLQQLDELWCLYSQGRFGFSVQVEIYRQVGEDYGRFCDRVGWNTSNQADSVNTWQFESAAPVGHLPSRLFIGGQNWWKHMTAIVACLQQWAE